jgi:hypothetical protein
MISSDKNRAILAEVIARTLREPELRAELLRAPKLTLAGAGMEFSPAEKVVILENTPTLIHAILPSVAEQNKYKALIDQASAHITELPEGTELRVLRDSANIVYAVIPPAAAETGSTELSDEALEAVAGGKGGGGGPMSVLIGGGSGSGNSAAQTQSIVSTTSELTEIELVAVVAASEVVAIGLFIVPCCIS